MYKKLILKNDYHNTQATFRVEHDGDIKKGDIITLTEGQIKKAKRLLCCDGYICSDALGVRAEWHKLGDEEIKISHEVTYDRQGNITGAWLQIEKVW